MRVRAGRVSFRHRVRGLPRFSDLAGGGGRYGRLLVFVAGWSGSRFAGFRAAWSGVPAFGCVALASRVRSGARVWRDSLAVAVVVAVVVAGGGGGGFHFGGRCFRVLWSRCAGVWSSPGCAALRWGLGCFGSGGCSAQGAGAAAVAGCVAASGAVGFWRFLVVAGYCPGCRRGFFMSGENQY